MPQWIRHWAKYIRVYTHLNSATDLLGNSFLASENFPDFNFLICKLFKVIFYYNWVFTSNKLKNACEQCKCLQLYNQSPHLQNKTKAPLLIQMALHSVRDLGDVAQKRVNRLQYRKGKLLGRRPMQVNH